MLPKYSFIVPIYNEEETIEEMYRRISLVMNRMDGPVELCLVNDGSRDRSLQLMRELHQKDPRVVYLSLARNFGHQIAVTAGLNFVRGKVVVILDADLQDPPELIPDMVEKWRQGYQIVYAQRIQRRQEGWFTPNASNAARKAGLSASQPMLFIGFSRIWQMWIFPQTRGIFAY